MTLDMSKLIAFRAALPQAIDDGVQDTAEQVERTAVSLVPIDTGALETSIQIDGASGSGERTVHAGQGLDYAAYVEYGTDKAPAQPFMTPAAEQNRANLATNITSRIKALA